MQLSVAPMYLCYVGRTPCLNLKSHVPLFWWSNSGGTESFPQTYQITASFRCVDRADDAECQ